MEVKRVCQSSTGDFVTIPMKCSHNKFVHIDSVTYLKGNNTGLCLKDSIGDLEESDKLCVITGLDYIVDQFNKRCTCKQECTRTTFITARQRVACTSTKGPHNIHVVYTCENAEYFKPRCVAPSTTTESTRKTTVAYPESTQHQTTERSTYLKTETTSHITSLPTTFNITSLPTTSNTRTTRPTLNINKTTNPRGRSFRKFHNQPSFHTIATGQHNSPTTTYSQTKPEDVITSKYMSNSVPAAVIAGATIGALLGAVILIFALFFIVKFIRRQKRTCEANQPAPSIVHVDHEERGGGNGALVVDNINQLNNLPKMKYNSLQRKAFILNTVVPAQQPPPRRLPDVVMNNDDIVLTPYAVSRNRDFVEGRLNYDTDNNTIIIHHDYARIKGPNRDSTLSDESDTSTIVTSGSRVGSGIIPHLSYARTIPGEQEVETERYKGELPNSPEYATVGPAAAKEDNSVINKVKHFETEREAVPSTSNQSLNYNPTKTERKSPAVPRKPDARTFEAKSNTLQDDSTSDNSYSREHDWDAHKNSRLSPQDSILDSQHSLEIPEGTTMENNPLYIQSRSQSSLSHTSI